MSRQDAVKVIVDGVIDDELFDNAVHLYEDVKLRLKADKKPCKLSGNLIRAIAKEIERIMLRQLANDIADEVLKEIHAGKNYYLDING